jgi:acyl-CoA reductase-like NAD-dependent aldehyde dehydrogenase
MYVDGKRLETMAWGEVRNPAHLDELVGEAPLGTAGDAALAVEAASRALPEWRSRPVEERAALLVEAGGDLQLRTGEWQELLTREHGKILFESGLDIQIAGALLDWYGNRPELVADRVVEDGSGRLVVRPRPLGVCAGIVPWNWPVVLSATKIGPALLAGNVLVLKMPDFSPLATLEALATVGDHFPPGVLNVVAGSGPEVGGALVADPRVRKVALTGGTATGKQVMAEAARTLKRTTFELGGNDAAILLSDVVLNEDVAANLMLGAFSTSGQICFAIKRLYVHRSRYEEFVDLFSQVVDSTVVGDGLDPQVTMGPVNNNRQYESVRRIIDGARSEGLNLVELGTLQGDASNGYFIRPHLVLDPPEESTVVGCEQFGPVLPIMVYDDEQEVVARANASPFGLCSSIWTADEEHAFALAEQLEAGTTFINGHSLFSLDLEAPFGGVKDSGMGRELGPEAVLEYVQPHAITNKRM